MLSVSESYPEESITLIAMAFERQSKGTIEATYIGKLQGEGEG